MLERVDQAGEGGKAPTIAEPPLRHGAELVVSTPVEDHDVLDARRVHARQQLPDVGGHPATGAGEPPAEVVVGVDHWDRGWGTDVAGRRTIGHGVHERTGRSGVAWPALPHMDGMVPSGARGTRATKGPGQSSAAS